MDQVPQISAPGSGLACSDRGVYALDEAQFRGLAQACTRATVCIDGTCAPAPSCSQGELGECLFAPAQTHGKVAAYVLNEDQLYWVELGTFDERANYLRDGAIARARLGDWQREELVSGLDFYDESRAELHHVSLRLKGSHLLLASASCCDEQHYYYSLIASDPPQLDDVGPVGCVGVERQYWVSAGTLYTRALPPVAAPEPVIAGVPAGFECADFDQAAIYLSRLSTTLRVTLSATPELRTVSTDTTLIGVFEGDLIARLNSSWIGRGTFDEAGNVSWLSVAGGSAGTQYVLHGDFVYWYHNSPIKSRTSEVVLRGRLDALDTQEVVAEAWDEVDTVDDTPTWNVSSGGIGWWPTGPGHQGFHYVPMHEPAADADRDAGGDAEGDAGVSPSAKALAPTAAAGRSGFARVRARALRRHANVFR
jgi:hypothetical protein